MGLVGGLYIRGTCIAREGIKQPGRQAVKIGPFFNE